jgi:Holliday junction DNA helicase RuvB P-loop domain
VVEDLEVIANMAAEGKQALEDPHVFLGPPGMGKTLLAKVSQNEINFYAKMARRGRGGNLKMDSAGHWQQPKQKGARISETTRLYEHLRRSSKATRRPEAAHVDGAEAA